MSVLVDNPVSAGLTQWITGTSVPGLRLRALGPIGAPVQACRKYGIKRLKVSRQRKVEHAHEGNSIANTLKKCD